MFLRILKKTKSKANILNFSMRLISCFSDDTANFSVRCKYLRLLGTVSVNNKLLHFAIQSEKQNLKNR